MLTFAIIIIGILVAILIIVIVLDGQDRTRKIEYWNNELYSKYSCDKLKFELNYENQFNFKDSNKIKSITKYLTEKECRI